jgi:hypothetical protein
MDMAQWHYLWRTSGEATAQAHLPRNTGTGEGAVEFNKPLSTCRCAGRRNVRSLATLLEPVP